VPSAETCVERCPVSALAMGEDNIPHVDADLCFGCAACATGCTEDSVKMVAKPGYEAPPENAKAMQKALITAFTKKG